MCRVVLSPASKKGVDASEVFQRFADAGCERAAGSSDGIGLPYRYQALATPNRERSRCWSLMVASSYLQDAISFLRSGSSASVAIASLTAGSLFRRFLSADSKRTRWGPSVLSFANSISSDTVCFVTAQLKAQANASFAPSGRSLASPGAAKPTPPGVTRYSRTRVGQALWICGSTNARERARYSRVASE